MKIERVTSLLIAVTLLCGFISNSFATEASFQGLGCEYTFASTYISVSLDGSTVAIGYGPSGRASRWTASEGMVSLESLDGEDGNSDALDISANGLVVVGRSGPYFESQQACIWTHNNGLIALGDLENGDFYSCATSVSSNGSVVVGWGESDLGSEAFYWTSNEGMIGLGDLNGGDFFSQAHGVSADGSVVIGRSVSSLGDEAFRWTASEGMIGLGDLKGGFFYSSAVNVSADGSTVVGWGRTNMGDEAFRWTASEGMIGLGTLSNEISFSRARAASADGSVIVGQSRTPSDFEAFIWDSDNGMQSLKEVLINKGLNMRGWTLRYATDISYDGNTIVGLGYNPDGDSEIWIATLSGPKVIYVDMDANGLGDGSSWDNAYNYLQDAIDEANYGNEIWVAQGIYTPDSSSNMPYGSGNREATFKLISGVKIKGGYAGLGAVDPNVRDIELYETILSGDLDGNDADVNSAELLDEPSRSDNSYHVVTSDATNTAVLDGFTITGGNADHYYHHYQGGGLYLSDSDLKIIDCTFKSNSVGSTSECEGDGGGIYSIDTGDGLTSLQIVDCDFIGNFADRGGGIYNRDVNNMSLVNCTFTNNCSDNGYGGAICNAYSSPEVNNCIFIGNSANDRDPLNILTAGGGAVCNESYSSPVFTDCVFRDNSSGYGFGGAIYNSGFSCIPEFLNCLFSDNYAGCGGAVYNIGFATAPVLSNCVFSANQSDYYGGAIYSNYCCAEITNCIFRSNKSNQGGAVYNDDDSCPEVIGCVFSGNESEEGGGGMYNDSSRPELVNCTFTGNYSANNDGHGIYNSGSSPVITNCILWGDFDNEIYSIGYVPIIRYSNIQGGYYGTGNIDADPLFIDADGVDGIVGTEDDNLQLKPISPCINAGTNDTVPALPDKDIKGDPRIKNGVVDMGAYEFVHKIFVDSHAPNDPSPYNSEISDPLEDGTEEHPFDNIQEAVDIAHEGQVVWVLPGSYYDDIIFSGKNIVVTSSDVNDWEVIESTRTQGYVEFAGTEDANCKFTGFCIAPQLYYPLKSEAAIYGNNTHATITHCIISRNEPCNATVVKDCDGLISNCLITDNKFGSCGQPRHVISGCGGFIRNCTIVNNETAGILICDNKSLKIQNCIIEDNEEPHIELESGSSLDISYCFLEDDDPAWSLRHNEDVNWGPYINEDGVAFVDESRYDYHLMSEGWRWRDEVVHGSNWTYDSYTTRGIDAGNPGSSLGEELLTVPDDPDHIWGENVRINIGAYGGTAQASMAPCGYMVLGDLDNNRDVNIRDLFYQIENWLETDFEQPGDLNRDGIIDMADFALIAKDWRAFSYNILPRAYITIISPYDGELITYNRTDPITVEVEVAEVVGMVVKIELYNNNCKIGEDNDGTDGWSIDWHPESQGSFELSVLARFSCEGYDFSQEIDVEVEFSDN